MSWHAKDFKLQRGEGRSLRFLLVLHFTFATLIPLLLFAFLSYVLVTENMKSRITSENRLTAAIIQREISAELQSAERTARWMADMTNKEGFEEQRFSEFFSKSLDYLPYFEKILTADKDGKMTGVIPRNDQLLGTSVANRTFFREVLSSGSVYWSTTFFSSVSQSTSVVCAVPLEEGILAAHINLERLNTIAHHIMQEGRRSLLMTDRNGAVIAARDRNLVEQRRNIADLEPVRRTLLGEEGTYDFTFQGERFLCYALRIESAGWPLLVLRPYADAFSLQHEAGLLLVGVMAVSMLLGIALSSFTGNRILAPLDRLAEAAREVAAGNYSFSQHSEIAEFHSVGNVLSEMSTRVKEREESLHTSLQEKNLLLMEIHHRVKNNLQLIMSLLSLKQSGITDAALRSSLTESINHIYSIAQVHEQLYHQRDVSSIDFYLYVDNLIYQLLSNRSNSHNSINFRNKVSSLLLDISSAIPCGLILNEIVTNACSHAFTEGCTGTITLEGYRVDETVHITLNADSCGFPEESLHSEEGLSLQIVQVLTEQLHGDISFSTSDFGCHYHLSFRG